MKEAILGIGCHAVLKLFQSSKIQLNATKNLTAFNATHMSQVSQCKFTQLNAKFGNIMQLNSNPLINCYNAEIMKLESWLGKGS